MERNGGVVSNTQVCDDFLEWEILSRLPVKSLMRFKCVCKRWQSMISKDQFFIDLHSSRSISTSTRRKCTSFVLIGNPIPSYDDRFPRSDRMYVLSVELLLPSDEEDGCVEVGTVCRWQPHIPKEHRTDVCTLNGLICFMDQEGSCASVYNCSTRESTPWIQSIIKKQEDKNDDYVTGMQKRLDLFIKKDLFFLKHELGYDPATKEYKVLALWSSHDDLVCEVLTVRQNSWRRIDGIPSFSIYYVRSVYVNGSIYLLCDHNDDFTQTIVEFNVGNEKLRIVETIDFGQHENPMELNGRLCTLSYDTQDEGYRPVKMRILHDHGEDVQEKKSKMATNSTSCTAASGSNYRWVEKTLSLPHHVQMHSPRHIPGTNLFIIRSLKKGFSFYHDNQQKKCYSFSKINSEISTALTDEKGLQRYRFEYNTFTPNLFPVN